MAVMRMMSVANAIGERVRAFFTKGDSRSVKLKKNIFGSMALKGISILISLLLLPVTIDYVNKVQYGIWLALSSLMTWFTFFDIGLAMGLRNRFAEAKAQGDHEKIRQYVSTTYAGIAVLAAVLAAIALPLAGVVDWSAMLKVDEAYNPELQTVMKIMMGFFALGLVLAVMTNILIGDQLTAASSVIGVTGQGVMLIVIWLLVRTQGHGTLTELAWILAGIPPAILLIATVVLFAKKYRRYRPSVRAVRPGMIRDLLGIGGKFFVITVSMLLIFQLMNIIISRELGPATVTEYNVAYRYFANVNMIAAIIMAPFWSATTDAYASGNLQWITGKIRQLEKAMAGLMLPGVALMLGISQWVYRIWVGDQVEVAWSTSISIAVYIIIICWSNTYMCIINGIGKVQLQLWIYVGFALVAYPLMTLLCRWFGIPGLLAIPALIYLVQAVAMRIQLSKIIAGRANGIWNK